MIVRKLVLLALVTVVCTFGQISQNPIQIENSNPGTSGWQLSNPATNREIEGYASLTSVDLGGQISFFVSTSDTTFHIDIFRTGWYQGIGARLLQTIRSLPGVLQPTPSPDSMTGLIECHWTSAYTLTVPQTWTTGIYLARLTGNVSGKQSYMIFVVRDDSSHSALVFNASFTTFEAYNFWPGGPNGKSLYNWAPGGRAWMVSFNRPFGLGFSYVAGVDTGAASGLGAGEYLTNLQPGPDTPSNPYPIFAAGFEYNMVRWLEENGYDVSYITNIDLQENGSLLLNHKGFLSVGHDEYWSMTMRRSIQTALADGVNLGFFGADPIYWQIRLQPGFDGTVDRTIICYKYDAAAADPDYTTDPQLATVEWRNAPVNMPEAALVGVEYIGDPWDGDIVVSNASHWLFNGTGLSNGSHLTGLLGYEVDAVIPGTSPSNVQILANSLAGPFTDIDDPGQGCTAGCSSDVTWYSSSGGSVFAAGSMQWSWGLDDYNAPALRTAVSSAPAQMLTANVLAAFIDPVTITMPSALPSAIAGQAYQLPFSALGKNSPFTWSASGLPSYLRMSTAGVLSGAPSQTGTVNFTVTVTDSASNTSSASFALVIATAPLTVTTTALPAGQVSSPYSYQLAATGGTPPYSWSVNQLPSGLTLSTAGLIGGTPTIATNAAPLFTVTDSSQNAASTNLTLTIGASASSPVITTTSLANAAVGAAYSETLTATGGAPPYKWSLASGSLPPGLSLNSDGQVSGTPTAYGTYSFSAQVIDNNLLGASANFTVVVSGYIDTFTATTMNSSIWCLCVMDQVGALDTTVPLQQGSGQLVINPFAGVSGLHYNGYLTLSPFNLTGASVTARIFQSTTGNADTSFALVSDINDWYHLLEEGGTLYVQTTVAGNKSTIATVAYNAAGQQYWRFTHNVTTNQLLVQTSPDNSSWTTLAALNVTVPVTALNVGLNAGTWETESSPGTAVFGPVWWQPGGTPATPTGLTATPGSAQVTLSWTASSGATSYIVQSATVNGGPYAIIASGVTTTSYTNMGLTNGTTYYYVVAAVSSAGQSPNSSQVSAQPSGTLSAPTGLTATPGNAQVTLSWTASSGATSYIVQSATVNGGPYTTIASGVTTTSYTNMGLTNGTTYYYVVAAVNAGGRSPNSSQVSAQPASLPAAPIGLTATPGNAQVSLSWTASSGATSYVVERATVNGGPYATIASGVTATSYMNTGLTNGTTYYYVVAALNAGGQSPNSSQVSAQPTGPPPAPTGLTATAGDEQVSLSWTASSGATSYILQRGRANGGPYSTIASRVVTTSYKDTGLTNGITYYYVVAAVNAGGESSNSSQVSAQPMAPPPVPSGLKATAGNAQVSLSWNVSSGAASYNVQQATASKGPYVSVAVVTRNNYVATGLKNGTTYYYEVSAVAAGGEASANSSPVSAQPVAPPAAPTGLTAFASDNEVTLSWNASTGATSYNVQRATVSGGPYKTVASVTATHDRDTGLTNRTTYYYVVSAVNGSGVSANSTQVSARP